MKKNILIVLLSMIIISNLTSDEVLKAKPTITNLRYRDIPFLSGSKLGILDNDWYEIIGISESTDNIDGMNQHWIQLRKKDEYIWAYGGYLEFSEDIDIKQLKERLSSFLREPIDRINIRQGSNEFYINRNLFVGFENDSEILKAYSQICGVWQFGDTKRTETPLTGDFSWGNDNHYIGSFIIDLKDKTGYISTGPVGATLYQIEKTENENEYFLKATEFGDFRKDLIKIKILSEENKSVMYFDTEEFNDRYYKISGPRINEHK